MGVRIGHVELNVPPATQDSGGTPSASLQLFPHLLALNQELTQHLRHGDHDRYFRLQWDLAALPYCLAATRAALVSFRKPLDNSSLTTSDTWSKAPPYFSAQKLHTQSTLRLTLFSMPHVAPRTR